MRIVVVQADSSRHPGGVADPLSIGLVRWRGQGERAALVAKLTLDLPRAAEGGLATLAPPAIVGPAVPSELREGELGRPSDFSFPKPRCDVMLVGHAHAAMAAERIAAKLAIGSFRLELTAAASPGAASIPLTKGHLEAGPHPGPRAVERESSEDRLDDFDFGRFQAALPSCQSDEIAADATLELTGLSVRAEQRVVTLPGLAPRLFVERGIDDYVELDLRCDTLLLDTDFERLELTWRAVMPRELARADRVIALVDEAGQKRALTELLTYLPRGTIGFAIEEGEAEPGDPDELEMARYEVLEHAAPPEIELDEYARISAELAEERRPRAETLAAHGFDERRWSIEERAFTEAVANDLAHGDGHLGVELGERIRAHQAAMKQDHEPRPVEDFIAVRRRILRGEPPKETLVDHEISPGEWIRLEQHWLAEAARDPAIARAIAETED